MEYNIKGKIFEATITNEPALLSKNQVYSNTIMGFGALMTDNYPHPCIRCKGTMFYICKEGDYFLSFCGEKPCMKKDSDASKAADREAYAKRQARNEHGVLITGAMQFKMGSLFEHASLAKWDVEGRYHSILSKWMNGDSKIFLVLGAPGTGKTFLCAAILNYYFESKREVHYTNHRRFIYEIQKGFGVDQTQEYSIDKIAYKDILIFDDLGAATNTEWQKEMILDLVDKRYSGRRKTLVTSNLTREEMPNQLGARTASRLLSRENYVIEFWETDRRTGKIFEPETKLAKEAIRIESGKRIVVGV